MLRKKVGVEVMQKGRYKNVVYIDNFDNDLFEQAIFILKPQAIKNNRRSYDYALQEARKIVNSYGAQKSYIFKPENHISKAQLLLKQKNRLYPWLIAGSAVCAIAAGAAILF